jgi:hypothetical protein
MKTENEIIIQLFDALILAQLHLNYCGWGDSWERSCAEEENLPEIIENALGLAREYILPK